MAHLLTEYGSPILVRRCEDAVWSPGGKVSIGPAGEEITASRGDFVRFPGDVPHATSVWSDSAVLHMVTTIPQVSQIGTSAH